MRQKCYYIADVTSKSIVYDFYAYTYKESIKLMHDWLRCYGSNGHTYDLLCSQLYNYITTKFDDRERVSND